MKYIDTGSRSPSRALGAWLNGVVDTREIQALRIQVGYVGPQPFGYLEPLLDALSAINGPTALVLGSNGGETDPGTVDALVRLAGPSRSGLQIGVVSYSDGLFHPKVYHVERSDGSQAAYVGSANFTHAGVSGKNIEAGLTLDSREGDDPAVLVEVSEAIDTWFHTNDPGFYPIRNTRDIKKLESAGLLNVKRLNMRPTSGNPRQTMKSSRRLSSLIRLPAISKTLSLRNSKLALARLLPAPIIPRRYVDSWSKKLPASDAQRKPSGNQSGVVALTQANRAGEIDQTTFFRTELFGTLVWQQAPVRSGHVKDIANVPMYTYVLGKYLGIQEFEITHDSSREANQGNYTTVLSLGPIREEFAKVNMQGKSLEIGRDAEGGFWLVLKE
ncbi:MAG: phospholipase D family protein [Cellulomonadaceae bacterium]|jgi:hypothetical protein|nr:phospholipase D family protein [Cellulomonadaceae bacterium]